MECALVYRLDNGGIYRQLSVMDEATVQLNVDSLTEGYVLVDQLPEQGTVYYDLDADEVRDRTEFPNFPQVGNKLHHIPEGTEVTWPDNVVTIETDGEVEVEVDVPAEVTFIFRHPRHFDKRVTINVSP